MVPRTTRLEYSIVAIALLVLLFCSKPPKPGTAGVNQPAEGLPIAIEAQEQTSTEPEMGLEIDGSESENQTQDEASPLPEPENGSENEAVTPAEPVSERAPKLEPLPIPTFTSGTAPTRVTPPSRPAKKMATVDARHTGKLNYKDVMQGEVSVRWVWNGQKFVPRKVCVVKEPNGVTSVWSFDNQDGTVLKEIE